MSMVIDERDTYQQQVRSRRVAALQRVRARALSPATPLRTPIRPQVRALQELLRDNADELQKFRKMMSAGGGAPAAGEDGAKKAAAVQERVNKLRASAKEGERALAEAARAAPPGQSMSLEAFERGAGRFLREEPVRFTCENLSLLLDGEQSDLSPEHLGEEDGGDVALVEASPAGWNEKGRFKLSPQTTQRNPQGRIWTHPVVLDGKLYLRDQEFISCYDIKG